MKFGFDIKIEYLGLTRIRKKKIVSSVWPGFFITRISPVWVWIDLKNLGS